MNGVITRHPLAGFLTMSVILHLWLLAGFGHALPETSRRPLGESVLSIHLPKPVLSSKSNHSSKPENMQPLTKSGAYVITAEATASSASTSIATIETPALASVTGAREAPHNQLLGELKTHLSQYLTYPPLARRLGWEGTVLLGLRVEPDGQLDEIRLEHSSGYAVLDNSALNSLKQIGQLVEARSWLNGRSVDLELPVIYRLIEN